MDIKIWCVRAFVSGWMRESVSLRVRECMCIGERERQTESLRKKACERMQGRKREKEGETEREREIK